jgi:Putative transposase
VADPRTGGVTAVQRFGGALNLNVHFHTLIPDGVFALDGGGPARFVAIPPPRDEEVEAILRRIVRRAAKALVGLEDDLGCEADALAALQAAEVERRIRYPDPFPHARRSAFLDGFSLHAGVRIHANDRAGLERLCRYALRPPLALRRLSRDEAGQLVYRMKRPRGGSMFLLLTPDQLLARLATLVPPPRTHGVRYHGVFAPHSSARRRVVPPAPAASPPASPVAEVAGRGAASDDEPVKVEPPRTYRVPWADLLKKVFALDILACPECSGRLKLIAFIASEAVARRILDHLGLDATGPPLARARVPDELLEPVPDHDAVDPVYLD